MTFVHVMLPILSIRILFQKIIVYILPEDHRNKKTKMYQHIGFIIRVSVYKYVVSTGNYVAFV